MVGEGGGSQYKRREEERRGTKSMDFACVSVDIRILGFKRKESVKVLAEALLAR